MAKYDVVNIQGEVVKQYDLNDAIFSVEYNEQVVFDAIQVARSNSRQATAKTLKRFEVRGGGRKPFRQKGTGRARQGSSRAPQMVGGGIVFGPTGVQNYKIKQNKKEARLALKSVLSEKVNEKNLIIVDDFKIETPKTKEFVAILKNINAKAKTLLVLDDEDNGAFLSARNIENLKIVSSTGINVYDIVKFESLVVSEKALAKIEEVFR